MSDNAAIVEKTVHLVPHVAEQLKLVARSEHLTEDEIVQKALEIFFSLSSAGLVDRQAWTRSSEDAFNRVWDNEQDAVYDNWKDIYGTPAR
jgi:hypothetical protein